MEEIFLSTCWPSTNQEMLNIDTLFFFELWFWSKMQTEISLSHYARRWCVLFKVYGICAVLQVIRCGIWVEVRCRNIIAMIVGRRVRGGHSHEPKQWFSSAVSIYFCCWFCGGVSKRVRRDSDSHISSLSQTQIQWTIGTESVVLHPEYCCQLRSYTRNWESNPPLSCSLDLTIFLARYWVVPFIQHISCSSHSLL